MYIYIYLKEGFPTVHAVAGHVRVSSLSPRGLSTVDSPVSILSKDSGRKSAKNGPKSAKSARNRLNGWVFVSQLRYRALTHKRLGPPLGQAREEAFVQWWWAHVRSARSITITSAAAWDLQWQGSGDRWVSLRS